jgi:hypothetical protein
LILPDHHWQRKLKMIVLSDMMYFTQIDDDIVIDQIPLAEIIRVKEMEGLDNVIADAKEENELMIETHPEGYNSGRTYYLQADSKVSCQDKIKRLSQYKKAAFERAHAQSLFRQAQRRVLKFYRSTWFQRVMAFLIILVRSWIVYRILKTSLTRSLTEFWCKRYGRSVQTAKLQAIR